MAIFDNIDQIGQMGWNIFCFPESNCWVKFADYFSKSLLITANFVFQ